MAGFNNHPSPSDCEHNGVSGWPIQLLQHAPLLRQAICRVVQRAGARLGIRSRSTLVEVSPDRQACFFYGAFGPTFGVNNEPATMDRLIPRFVIFPQAAEAYTTARQPVIRRDWQEPS